MNFVTIGTSKITEAFIDAAVSSGRYKLRAVYSRDLDNAQRFAEKNDAEKAYANFEDIIKDDIPLVYIASPNALHFEQAMYFLKKGKNVIVEKPIATRKGQFEALYKTAQEQNVFLFEAFRHINSPGFACIKNHIKEIAPIRNIILTFNQYSSKYDAFKEGKGQNVFDTAFDGGATFDLGVYPVSLAVALFGRPKNMASTKLLLDNGVDGAGSYIFEYDGFLCNITFSKISEGLIQSEILGENGGILIDIVSRLTHIELRMKNEEFKDITPFIYENDMRHEAEVFADIIENKDISAYQYQYQRLIEISAMTNEILVKE